MGKKKNKFPPSKEMNFHFRMTKELYEVLRTDADLQIWYYLIISAKFLPTGNKPTIKKRIEVVFNDPEILQIFHNLRTCGNNLNQTATNLNDGRTMTDQIWKDIKECISELYEMHDNLKEISIPERYQSSANNSLSAEACSVWGLFRSPYLRQRTSKYRSQYECHSWSRQTWNHQRQVISIDSLRP